MVMVDSGFDVTASDAVSGCFWVFLAQHSTGILFESTAEVLGTYHSIC